MNTKKKRLIGAVASTLPGLAVSAILGNEGDGYASNSGSNSGSSSIVAL